MTESLTNIWVQQQQTRWEKKVVERHQEAVLWIKSKGQVKAKTIEMNIKVNSWENQEQGRQELK